MRLFLRTAILALFFGSSGCGILIQTVMGWHERHTERRTENHPVHVSSAPSGAEISRKNPGGSIDQLGPAPFTDTVTYDVDVVVQTPRWGGLLVGGLIDTAISLGLIYAIRSDNGNDSSVVIDIYILSLVALPEVITALVWGNSGSTIKGRKQVPSTQWYTYTARANGLPDATASIRAPDQGRAELVLGPHKLVQRVPKEEEEDVDAPGGIKKPEIMADDTWTIAVMNVEDLHDEKKDRAIDKALIESLGDQLRIVIAQQGVRTIDRITQDRALADQISVMKGDTMKACNDDSCQIELGKALAASHIVRARVSRSGGQCVFNAELIDLKVEETKASSAAQGECAAQGLFNMTEEAARNLVKK